MKYILTVKWTDETETSLIDTNFWSNIVEFVKDLDDNPMKKYTLENSIEEIKITVKK